MDRSKPFRIAVFNHKGGIGKTTLALNISAALGSLKKKVLMVDSDPQCNLTAYLFAEEVINEMLDESDYESGRTIWSAVKGLTEGNGPLKKVRPYETSIANVSLIPGDVKLSNYEAALGNLWMESLARRLRGLQGTTAISDLVSKCVSNTAYDYVIYDTGPNIGPLNRAILLDCDYFIVPVAYDLFSARALSTLGQTLKSWIKEWETIAAIAPDGVSLFPGQPEFLGYLPIEFRGLRHDEHAKVKSHFEAQINIKVKKDIMKVLPTKKGGMARSASAKKLGSFKDYQSLVTLSQHQGCPIFSVKDESGSEDVAAEVKAQAAKAKEELLHIARNIVRKTR